MTEQNSKSITDTIKRNRALSTAILLIGFIAFIFSSGKYNVAIAAWVWPVCILFATSRKKQKQTLIMTCVLLIIGACVKWYGCAGEGIAVNIFACALLGLLAGIPFILNHLLYEKIGGFKATLLLPLTFAVIEVLVYRSPLGFCSPVAATQTGDVPLMQIVSVFGPYGITVLVTWLASICLYVVDNRSFDPARAKKAAIIYISIMVAVFLFGGVRLALSDTSATNIKIAMTTGPYSQELLSDDAGQVFTLEENVASLEKSAKTASDGGADMLIYCEEAFTVSDTSEKAMIRAAEKAAKENNIDLLVAFDVLDTDNSQKGLEDNVQYLIDYHGKIVWQYYKNHLVPFMEADISHKGDGIIPSRTLTLPSARQAKLASVICMDSDYPSFIRDSLANDTQLLLVPTWDWSEIRTYHPDWVMIRSIENGVSLARSTMNGISTVTDPYGRVITSSDTTEVGYEQVVFSQVPAESVFTVYKYAGKVLDWCYVAGLLLLILIGITRKKSSTPC